MVMAVHMFAIHHPLALLIMLYDGKNKPPSVAMCLILGQIIQNCLQEI